MEVDPTLSCGHRCPNCTYGGYHQNVFLEDRVAERIIQALPDIGIRGMIITGGGEPCLYRNLGDFVKAVSQTGVDVTLTTNGQQFHRHLPLLMTHLKRVRFSIDAATPEVFRLTHGMDAQSFNQVMENLRVAVDYKRAHQSDTDIGVSFLICEPNAHEVEEAVALYRGIGVDFIHFKPMQFWDKRKQRYYHKPMPGLHERISDLQKNQSTDFHVSISREKYYRRSDNDILYRRCHGSHFDLIIGADGKTYTCCHFKYHPAHCYGDLDKESIGDVLLRVKDSVSPECFPDCKMDAINQLLELGLSQPKELLRYCRFVSPQDLPLGSKWL